MSETKRKMLKYRLQLFVQMLFFGLLAAAAVYAAYQLAVIILDVLDIKYRDEWSAIWISALGVEILVSGWFLMQCVKTINGNMRRLFHSLH
jgi:hypothetical protein